MSTFAPKRPDSRQKDRYSPTGPNVTYTRTGKGTEVPGTAVYGIQEIPVKKPLKAKFEKEKAVLNERTSVPRPGKNFKRRDEIESNRPSPIAMNPEAPARSTKATPTFKSSPDNPLAHKDSGSSVKSNVDALRNSSRYAARVKFEAARSNGTVSIDENKFAGQKKAYYQVKDIKQKENRVLKDHPHGATKGIIHNKHPEGLFLPGLGFGGALQS